ncbi:hypothetical protein ACQPW1_29520 [Nocardia sp. CA-128927]|uniref:hypothetical protein n=1 Tax=Nocardia sp. CA-128927 TaxID=3239975 RepID=UPI003D98DB45
MIDDNPAHDDTLHVRAAPPAEEQGCADAGGGAPRNSASHLGWRVLLAASIIGATLTIGWLLMPVTGYAHGDAQTGIIPAIVCAAAVVLCGVRVRVAARRGYR